MLTGSMRTTQPAAAAGCCVQLFVPGCLLSSPILGLSVSRPKVTKATTTTEPSGVIYQCDKNLPPPGYLLIISDIKRPLYAQH